MDESRRDFLKKSAVIAAGMSAGFKTMPPFAQPETDAKKTNIRYATPASVRKGDMLYRALGDTGTMVSLIGVGGSHAGRPREEKDSIRIIRSAIDAGVNFMDNCWDYGEGESEKRMGKALEDGYREKVFLMSKIDGRDRKTAARQIDESLTRLRTDRLDLMQHHEIIRLEDGDLIFREDGAQRAMLDAQKAGKIRFIGFTGHKDPLAHLRMLDVARQNGFRFDAVQMPLNVMDAHFRSFEQKVLPVLVKDRIGVLGMKSLAGRFILESKTASAVECLHYAMNLPTSTVITGIEKMEILEQALEAVRTFQPLTREAVDSLLARTAEAASLGRYEKFKTTAMFDGTAIHPEWLGKVG